MLKRLFNPQEFARRIRVRMAEEGMDMKTAARLIGCSHSTISRVCAGISAPDVENYLRIEKWLSKAQAKPSTSRVSG